MTFRHLTIACMLISAPAAAKDVLQPVQVGAERVRYDRGEFVLDLRGAKGAVRISPAGHDHNNAAFHIAVFNDGEQPLNFDISNVTVDAGGPEVRLLSRDEMIGKAKSRAAWAAGLSALAGGLAAVSAANQRNHYSATTFTPRGTYRTVFSTPSAAGQVQAAVIAAGTGATLARIGDQLDQTTAALSSEMVQMTTIDPGDSYGGLIYLTRFKKSALPMTIRLTVSVNGESYPFAMRYVKKGTPALVFNAATTGVMASTPAPVLISPVTAQQPNAAPDVLSTASTPVPITTTAAVVLDKR